MTRCPTCHARLNGRRVCRRCKTDLNRLFEIAELSRDRLQAAVESYYGGRYEAMFREARRGVALGNCVGGRRLLACAALLTGRFATALKIWHSLQKSQTGNHSR